MDESAPKGVETDELLKRKEQHKIIQTFEKKKHGGIRLC